MNIPSAKRTAMMEYGVSPAPGGETRADDEDEELPVVSKRTLPSVGQSARSAAAANETVSERPPAAESRGRKKVVAPLSSRDAATIRPRRRRGDFWTGVILPAVVSAAVVFVLFSWGIVPLLEQPAADNEPAQAASALVAPPKPKAAGVELKTETLPLPAGIQVQSGLGLLEVEVSEPLALYVDGEFVGKVVLRRVPLQPGRHQMTIGEGERGKTVSVDITVGARTRVTLPAPPPR
jgi:hypothetical protein